jgi:hypothetical protein
MTEFENNMNKEIDIATWEDEGGALKPQPLQPKKHNPLMIFLGLIAVLPLVYWLVKKSLPEYSNSKCC